MTPAWQLRRREAAIAARATRIVDTGVLPRQLHPSQLVSQAYLPQ